MPPQMQEKPRARKKKQDKKDKLAFDPGKVFDVSEAKAEDVELDLDAARFRAAKGQGGDRRA